MTSPSATKYQNWPDAYEYNIPYKAPPKGSNPAVKGLILRIGAPLVEKLGFASKFLYNQNGFGKLGKVKELQEIKQRYDPTVIPIVSDTEKVTSQNPADPSVVNQSLISSTQTPLNYSIRDYHEAFKTGRLTPTVVAKALLPLISRDVPKRSVHSVAFLTSNQEQVLAAAEASTKRWAEGKPLGLLDGVPLAVKDEVDLAGYKKTFASKHVFVAKAEKSSWCVEKWEEAGAIIIGKTNMHEVGMDTTNNNPTYGTPKNPYNDQYYTGGSSGGSGYAVAMGLVPVALGCDGGGSIRIPSNYCGIYGLKTSHSRVSTHPSPDLAGTTAVAGPMAIDMDSLALAYRVMATPDPNVSASALFAPSQPLSAPRKKIIGIFRPWYDNSDAPVKASCDAAVEWLKKTYDYTVVDVTIPLVNEGQLAHALTIMMEVFNGLQDRSFLQPANRILMSVGGNATANDFLNAQKTRQVLMQHLAHLFDTHGHDLIIVTPTTPNAGWSFKKGDLKSGISDGDKTIRSMQYVWLANFTGNPAISVPVAYVDPKAGKNKIPVGLMGMGIWGGEEALIEFGYECEKYLHEVVEGGQTKPANWVDVFALSSSSDEKSSIVEDKASIANGNGVHKIEEPPIEQTKLATEPVQNSKVEQASAPVPETATEAAIPEPLTSTEAEKAL
jgi:Asp-tRNA(Asn)/Glu-tRNA(Gln) amidotransferase A subunit family amidase